MAPGEIVVPAVEGCVGHREILDAVEIPVHRPGDDALVVHVFRNGEGAEHPGRILPDAVAVGQLFVLHFLQGVHFMELAVELLLEIVFLALRLAQGVVPGDEGGLCGGHGVRGPDGIQLMAVRRVYPCPQGVAVFAELYFFRPQGIAHPAVDKRIYQRHVIFVSERIRFAEGIRREDGVPCSNRREGVAAAEVDFDAKGHQDAVRDALLGEISFAAELVTVFGIEDSVRSGCLQVERAVVLPGRGSAYAKAGGHRQCSDRRRKPYSGKESHRQPSIRPSRRCGKVLPAGTCCCICWRRKGCGRRTSLPPAREPHRK